MMRLLTIFFVLVLANSITQACESASSSQVQHVLKESIRLNDEFKKSVNGSDDKEYRRSRKRAENYEETKAIPCLKRAGTLLRRSSDLPLLETLFAHAYSHENSADETESEVIASVFVERPSPFLNLWKASPVEVQRAVSLRTRTGWVQIKEKFSISKRKQVELNLQSLLTK